MAKLARSESMLRNLNYSVRFRKFRLFRLVSAEEGWEISPHCGNWGRANGGQSIKVGCFKWGIVVGARVVGPKPPDSSDIACP